ncbi:MAG TPA: MarR family transcriptional regulator [Candidatus Limnocylindrales bacterium]
MRDAEAVFVDAMGQFMGGYGMTPMAGRLWAWLLICEPAEQTAAELADQLMASRGAISGAAAFLAASGMIRRTRRRGDRREYFSAPPGTFDAILRSIGSAYGRLSAITGEGLRAVDGAASARSRLAEVHDAAVFIQSTFPALIEQHLAERSARLAAGDADAPPAPVRAARGTAA